MPKRGGEPLRKVTLNLFDEDCSVMAGCYGFGWSEVVRDLVRDHVQKELKIKLIKPRFVGDLDGE